MRSLSLQLSLVLLSLLTLIQAQGFSFTGPPAGNQLNLTTPIPVTWTSSDSQFPQFDLWFQGPGFAYSLQKDLSTATGNYTWDPTAVSGLLQRNQVKLPYGNQYNFQARFHQQGANASSGEGAAIESGMYSVTGYPFLGSAGALQGVGTMGVIAVASLVSWLMI